MIVQVHSATVARSNMWDLLDACGYPRVSDTELEIPGRVWMAARHTLATNPHLGDALEAVNIGGFTAISTTQRAALIEAALYCDAGEITPWGLTTLLVQQRLIELERAKEPGRDLERDTQGAVQTQTEAERDAQALRARNVSLRLDAAHATTRARHDAHIEARRDPDARWNPGQQSGERILAAKAIAGPELRSGTIRVDLA
ncbi:MAG: hypothetical protein ACLPXB_16940 [Thiobacillaceae bacterium]